MPVDSVGREIKVGDLVVYVLHSPVDPQGIPFFALADNPRRVDELRGSGVIIKSVPSVQFYMGAALKIVSPQYE